MSRLILPSGSNLKLLDTQSPSVADDLWDIDFDYDTYDDLMIILKPQIYILAGSVNTSTHFILMDASANTLTGNCNYNRSYNGTEVAAQDTNKIQVDYLMGCDEVNNHYAWNRVEIAIHRYPTNANYWACYYRTYFVRDPDAAQRGFCVGVGTFDTTTYTFERLRANTNNIAHLWKTNSIAEIYEIRTE